MAKRLMELPTEANIDLDRRLFNPVYMPIIFGRDGKIDIHRYNVLYGGAGSGKSFAIGQMWAIHMTIMSGRNLVCLRKQKTDCIKSCWAFIYNALKQFHLDQYWIIKENPEHRMINRVNGNEILFEGVDNIEDIKSIQFTQKHDNKGGSNLTDVWYEEVNAEDNPEVIRELDRRLRDPYVNVRIVLSFNPVSRTHFLFDLVTREWRFEGVDSYILKTTYKDNKHLPADYGETLERYKYTDPYAYQVYALGNWGTMGETVFNANKIAKRLQELTVKYSKSPPTIGEFTYKVDSKKIPEKDSFKFGLKGDGHVRIYKMPETNHPYVLAVDTAEGGNDYYAAHVCDNITGEQVAVYHSNQNSNICVWQVYGLACMYNHALFCPEVNFDSWPVKAFLMLDYPNMYRRMSPSDKTHVRREDRYGFRTGVENRQLMLTEMVEFTDQNMELINDMPLLEEMQTFTRQDKKLKGIWWGAEAGAHDDLVMAYAILLQARVQQSMEAKVDIHNKIEGDYWLREELEDAVAEGKIDRYQMLQYIDEKGIYTERGSQVPLGRKARTSRYAR